MPSAISSEPLSVGDPSHPPSISEFREEARQWLAARVPARETATLSGDGDEHSVSVWHNLTYEAEKALIDRLRAWRRVRFDAGYGPISWEPEYGGRGLPPAYELAFAEEESNFLVPARHEAVGITTELIAPTIRTWGDDSQKRRYLRPMLRGDELWCQLMSEPTAGSDVGGLITRAVRDGDAWTINGQKVWTSGARHADWGYLLARSDHDAPKHQGITAFIVPMGASGVEVRPIRQMSGGASFNEVFFTDVRLPDSMRLGPENSGWRVAMTTLGFERVAGSGEGNDLLARFDKAAALAKQLQRSGDPVVRQHLARSYTLARLSELNNERVRQAWMSGATPGPEGSIGKLFHGLGLAQLSEMISVLLGSRLIADSGETGTYQWAEHVTGAPGSRIAGGTDEIQRNVLAERMLGLPREPPMRPTQA